MRVGFDIHGTIDKDDKLLDFVKLISTMDAFQVFIISGPPLRQIVEEVKLLGIQPYKVQIISVVDWLRDKGTLMWKDENGWWCEPEIWWESKSLICYEYSIDIIFDDKIEYAKHMSNETKFILWKGENR